MSTTPEHNNEISEIEKQLDAILAAKVQLPGAVNQTAAFLKSVIPPGSGYIEIYSAFPEGSHHPNRKFEYFEDAHDAALCALRRAKEGRDVWFGVVPRRRKGTGRVGASKNVDCGKTYCFWSDIDSGDHSKMKVFPLRPNIVVESSPGKFQCYWLLAEPCDFDRDLLERLIEATGGDLGAKDHRRVLRVPETWNRKPKYGTTPPLVHIKKFEPEMKYSLDDIRKAVGGSAVIDKPVVDKQPPDEPKLPATPSASLEELRDLLSRKDPSCDYKEWIKAGMVAHHVSGGSKEGFTIWNEWSADSEKYKGSEDLRSHWQSFGGSDNPVTIDYLRKLDSTSPASKEEFENLSTNNPTDRLAPNWPTPEPLQGELPLVESFKIELLPKSLQAHVLDIAERQQVPLDFPAALAVCCLAGAVNRRARIQPKAKDDKWQEVPNLWGAFVAPPGCQKTPIYLELTEPLKKIDREWQSQYEVELAFYNSTGIAPPKGEAVAPDSKEKPKLQQLIVNSSTPEKLHVTLSENQAGVFVVRDELTGLLGEMDKKGREDQRAFFLSAWNGKDTHKAETIGRGRVYATCCLSLFGGIQPGLLTTCLVDAERDDGFIQRFQVLVYPDPPADFEYIDRPPDKEAAERVERIFRVLVKLDPNKPTLYRFAPDAQEFFIQWFTALQRKTRKNDESPALIAHLKKYPGLMASLALLFEMADRAAIRNLTEGAKDPNEFDADSTRDFVSLEHARQAVAWCDYLESHARRVYSCRVLPEQNAALKLARAIQSGKITAKFTNREVLRKVRSFRTVAEVKAAIRVLKDAGWLRSAGNVVPEGGGTPSEVYEVNPAVYQK